MVGYAVALVVVCLLYWLVAWAEYLLVVVVVVGYLFDYSFGVCVLFVNWLLCLLLGLVVCAGLMLLCGFCLFVGLFACLCWRVLLWLLTL